MKTRCEKLFIFSFLSATLVFTSCNFKNSSSNSNDNDRAQQLRARTDEVSSSSRNCDSNRSGQTTINIAKTINSENAGEYSLSGRCDIKNKEVTISVDRNSIDINCYGGRWRVYLDLTSIAQSKDKLEISARSGSDEACVSVDNLFQCPDKYTPIPRLDGFTDRDFCVMKYEAKREYGNRNRSSFRGSSSRDEEDNYDEKAISNSGDDSWVEISHTQAREKCANNGLGYRLIRNEEWQTIARHIEDEDRNWSSGKSSSSSNNFLNYGILTTGAGSSYRSSSSRSSSDRYRNSDWYPEKRSHYLPNGEEIWDLSGGVWEYVEESASELGVQKEENPIFDLSSKNRELFGSANHYSEPSYNTNIRNTTRGLGYAYLSKIEDRVIRGGGHSIEDLGIFSVDASISDDDSIFTPTGFRCVYSP